MLSALDIDSDGCLQMQPIPRLTSMWTLWKSSLFMTFYIVSVNSEIMVTDFLMTFVWSLQQNLHIAAFLSHFFSPIKRYRREQNSLVLHLDQQRLKNSRNPGSDNLARENVKYENFPKILTDRHYC